MAGYDFSEWKSNNALAAEERGLLTAGQIARRLGVSTAAIRACISPREWHHVGGGFARVDYFAPWDVTPLDVRRLEKFDAAAAPQSWLVADVTWLEWPSFKIGRFSRNRDSKPRVIEHRGVRVTRESASTFRVFLGDGREIVKRATTKGLVIRARTTDGDEVVVDNA